MSYNITINYEIQNNTATPMSITKYVRASASNPTSIEADGSATLKFNADGTYFIFQKNKALAVKVTGASFTWSVNNTATEADIVLSNPTDNVIITIKAKVNVTPQEVTKPFLLQKAFPVDTRLVLSKNEMIEMHDDNMPNTYFALCKDDGHFYLYNKGVEASEETGKFRIITDMIEQPEVTISIIRGGDAFSE